MPDNSEIIKNEPEQRTIVSEKENTLGILLQRILGDDSLNITEKQVDEMLVQRSKVYDYIHEDKKQESSDKRFYFTASVIVSAVIIILVLFFAKEYLTQVMSLIVGAFGGYGIGKSQGQ